MSPQPPTKEEILEFIKGFQNEFDDYQSKKAAVAAASAQSLGMPWAGNSNSTNPLGPPNNITIYAKVGTATPPWNPWTPQTIPFPQAYATDGTDGVKELEEPPTMTRAHVVESMVMGGKLVGGATGVLVGIPLLVAALTPIHFGVVVLFACGVAGLCAIAFLLGDHVVTKENKFYVGVLERMTRGGKK